MIGESLSKPATFIAGAIVGSIAHYIYQHDWQASKKYWHQRLFDYLPSIPYVGPKATKKLDEEFEPQLDKLDKDIHSKRHLVYRTLPKKGVSQKKLLDQIQRDANAEHLDDKISGAIYRDLGLRKLNDLNAKISEIASQTNPLHREAWPDIPQREAEVIAWCADLYGGDINDICGNITNGGTFSIMEAMRTYKAWANETRGITRPNMVVPANVHAAFDKGAKDYGIELIKVPVNPFTQLANVAAMAKKINKDTIAIVGSAPSYPCGAIDPIKDLSDLAQKHQIGLHVDACLGGFLLPFAKAAGHDVGQFGFDLPGVTSVSLDPHKYGQTPKGSSIVMFRKRIGKYQAYIELDHPIGMYATPNQAGSRNGEMILKTWATLAAIGYDKFVRTTKKILDLKIKIKYELQKIRELTVLGNVDLSVIAVDSPNLNIYAIHEQMKKKGWSLNTIQNVNGIHLCLTANHLRRKDFAKRFIVDLKQSIQYVKSNPHEKLEGDGAVYAGMAAMPKTFAPHLKMKLGREYVMLTGNIEETRNKKAVLGV